MIKVFFSNDKRMQFTVNPEMLASIKFCEFQNKVFLRPFKFANVDPLNVHILDGDILYFH